MVRHVSISYSVYLASRVPHAHISLSVSHFVLRISLIVFVFDSLQLDFPSQISHPLLIGTRPCPQNSRFPLSQGEDTEEGLPLIVVDVLQPIGVRPQLIAAPQFEDGAQVDAAEHLAACVEIISGAGAG